MRLGSIALILISGWYAAVEIWEVFHKPEPEPAAVELPDFSTKLKDVVNAQVQQLGRVDPVALGTTFENSLETTNCAWFVDCTPIVPHKQAVTIGGVTFDDMESVERPRLLVRFGPLPIPTWHTISGAPRALLQLARAVAGSGWWATAMFLACAVFWFAVLVSLLNADNLIAGWMMLIGAPIGISWCVWAVQHMCMGLLHAFGVVGGGFAVLLMGLMHSAALTLVIGFRHLYMTRRELAEEVEKLRGV